ncbi:MAG: hypothetical protein LBK66_04940, partial [Spirochaetaceae bacterium]|nr:hypothetical protein [Spirochaetaceae bacterium]
MEEYNLRKIFEQIINISQNIEPFTVEELWKWTKFINTNEYLNNSLVIHKHSGVPIEGRKEKLNLQNIKGKYLLFDFIGHLPEMEIKQYNNFEELIESIISVNGILNPFTTLQIPIINGEAKNILFVLKYKTEISFENKLEKETMEEIKNEII